LKSQINKIIKWKPLKKRPDYAKIWLCQLNLSISNFNPVESALAVEDTWRVLAISFDVK
jgi:hypothetical protein